MFPSSSPKSIQDLKDELLTRTPDHSKSIKTTHFYPPSTHASHLPQTDKKPPSGVHPLSQNTFQASGFWVPNCSTRKFQNKVKIKSSAKKVTNPNISTTSSPITSATNSKCDGKYDLKNCRCKSSNGSYFQEDKQKLPINLSFEESHDGRQNVPSNEEHCINNTHDNTHIITNDNTENNTNNNINNNTNDNNQNKTNERMIEMTNELRERTNHNVNRLAFSVSDNFFHRSDSTQNAKHVLQTSAEIFSKYVSPFHNLSYCRKTNLNQTKVSERSTASNQESQLISSSNQTKVSERSTNQSFEVWKLLENTIEFPDRNKIIEDSKTSNEIILPKSRVDQRSDFPERQENKEQKKEEISFVFEFLSKKMNERTTCASFIEIPQLKTRAGSLTETSKENQQMSEFEGDRIRMRGLSLSASCLPFKPFQLQKPNLPWNRVSPVSTSATNSIDRKFHRESFKNYVRVNIMPEKTVVNRAKKRIESCLHQDDVRRSLPAFWKNRTFPSSKNEENLSDDFSTSVDSLQSVSTKCSIPSIQISTFDSTEELSRIVETPLPESPVGETSERTTPQTSNTMYTDKMDGSQIPSSPPPPVPPRNKSLYHNLRTGKSTSTGVVLNSEVQFRDRGKVVPSCSVEVGESKIKEIKCGGSQNGDRLSPEMIYDFKPRESQDYVMAMIKHEKSYNNGSSRYHSVTLRSSNSEKFDDNSRDQRVQEVAANNIKDIQRKSIEASDSLDFKSKALASGKKIPEQLHLVSKSATLAPESIPDPLPSPDEKLKNFVIPCLWFNSTPYDRLLISILDPRNTLSDLDKMGGWDGYKRLLQPLSPVESSTNLSSFGDATSPNSSFSSLNTSTDNSSGNSSKHSLPQSPVSPFRTKFSAFEEQKMGGSEVGDSNNTTIVDSVHTIVSNYHELESRIKKLLTTTTDAKTQERFSQHLEQMDTALQLIAKLTDQMTKLSSDSIIDHTKQNRLIEKLAEARDLKMNIDKKGEKLALKIKNSIDQRSYEMLEFLLKARTYVTLLNRSNFIDVRRKASNPSIGQLTSKMSE